jgi:hypothetical protein
MSVTVPVAAWASSSRYVAATDGFLSATALPWSMTETASADGITARYEETDGERRLTFERDGRRATVAQNADGYAMLKVRDGEGDELERYYGFDMALDHAAELLGADIHDLPVPDGAADMGM